VVASEPGKDQNLVYSIEDPDAATPTLTGPASVNNAGYTFVLHPNMALQPLVITKDSPVKQRSIGQKQYELSDHLGNARVVLSDIKEGDWNTTTTAIEDYRPQLLSRADYYAFGSLLPGRNYSSDSYRFGFNGMPKDDEMHIAIGTSYDFGARLYDPRVGRWLSLDPLAEKYPSLSPYSFTADNPILFVDPNGEEIFIFYEDEKGNLQAYEYGSDLEVPNSRFVQETVNALNQLLCSTEVQSIDDYSLSPTDLVTTLRDSQDKHVMISQTSGRTEQNIMPGNPNWAHLRFNESGGQEYHDYTSASEVTISGHGAPYNSLYYDLNHSYHGLFKRAEYIRNKRMQVRFLSDGDRPGIDWNMRSFPNM